MFRKESFSALFAAAVLIGGVFSPAAAATAMPGAVLAYDEPGPASRMFQNSLNAPSGFEDDRYLSPNAAPMRIDAPAPRRFSLFSWLMPRARFQSSTPQPGGWMPCGGRECGVRYDLGVKPVTNL